MKSNATLRISAAVVVILGVIAYLAVTGVQANKSYYYTIAELQKDPSVYAKNLRVAGNVQPGSIRRNGSSADFVLVEQGRTLPVSYQGMEPPPDTFKDNSQALAQGTLGHDGVFHATQIQAKCTSKYAPQDQKAQPAAPQQTASSM